jgi:hypothetical protein
VISTHGDRRSTAHPGGESRPGLSRFISLSTCRDIRSGTKWTWRDVRLESSFGGKVSRAKTRCKCCGCLFMALFGRGAMPGLSPLSGVKQKAGFGVGESWSRCGLIGSKRLPRPNWRRRRATNSKRSQSFVRFIISSPDPVLYELSFVYALNVEAPPVDKRGTKARGDC